MALSMEQLNIPMLLVTGVLSSRVVTSPDGLPVVLMVHKILVDEWLEPPIFMWEEMQMLIAIVHQL